METVILVIHVLLALALIGVIMLQRSEGGGLGIGGSAGGGMGSFMSARGTANLLTRSTTILAACFMGTSLILAILAGADSDRMTLSDQLREVEATDTAPPAEPGRPSVPVSE